MIGCSSLVSYCLCNALILELCGILMDLFGFANVNKWEILDLNNCIEFFNLPFSHILTYPLQLPDTNRWRLYKYPSDVTGSFASISCSLLTFLILIYLRL